MNYSELKSHCKLPLNDGVSVWTVEKRSPALLCNKPKGIPQLNCNSVYMILEQRHGYSVLSDRPYAYFKVYFWIGAKAIKHQSKIEQTMVQLEEMVQEDPCENGAKLRIWIEYQYSESLEFFALFTKLPSKEAIKGKKETFLAIQYQEYTKNIRTEVKQRAVPFPKVLIVDHTAPNSQAENQIFRIYERDQFDSYCPLTKEEFDRSQLAFIFLEGQYVDYAKKPMLDLSTNEQLKEVVSSMQVLVGGEATDSLKSFISMLKVGYTQKNPNLVVQDVSLENGLDQKVQHFIQRSKELMVDQHLAKIVDEEQKQEGDDYDWPITDYNQPYKIQTTDWTPKSREERERNVSYENLSTENVIYKGQLDLAGDMLQWEDQAASYEPGDDGDKELEEVPRYEPNDIHMFRVAFEKKATLEELKEGQQLSGSEMHEHYYLHLEKLKIARMTPQEMSSRHVYLIYTPVRLYIWLGSEVEQHKRNGSLRIMKNYCRHILKEPTTFRPGYYSYKLRQDQKNLISMRLRIEYDGYESSQLAALVGKMRDVPSCDSRIDYLMMRIPKLTDEEEGDDLEEDTDVVDDMPSALNSALSGAFSRSATSNFDNQRNRNFSTVGGARGMTTKNLRQSVKVNFKSKETSLKLKNLALITRQRTSKASEEEKKGLDMEETRQKQEMVNHMSQLRSEDQKIFIKKIRAQFNPLSILQLTNQVLSKKQTSVNAPPQHMLGQYDAIWQFEIVGRKFEQVTDPLRVGILEAIKSYFIVFYKAGKASIALWRGNEQSQLDFLMSVLLFKKTKFRLLRNNKRTRGTRSQSTTQDAALVSKARSDLLAAAANADDDDPPSLGDVGKSASEFAMGSKGGGLDLTQMKRNSAKTADDVMKQEMKHTFCPINQVQQNSDPAMLERDHAINLESFKRDELVTEINLRQLLQMDSEPMAFLQAFQGALVIVNNAYMTRSKQVFDDQIDEDEQEIMMFQIIGIHSLNQKAREVPPFKSSLTSSGLFIVLSKKRIFFWVGSEYYGDYLGDDVIRNEQFYQSLLSDELFTKLVDLYDKSQSFIALDDEEEKVATVVDLEERKISLCIEGMEGQIWHDYLNAVEMPVDRKVIRQHRKTAAVGYHRMRTQAFNMLNKRDEEEDQYEESSSEDGSDGTDSDESDIELVDYENELTSKMWLPSEPKLYTIFNGRKFVNFNDEQDLVNRDLVDSDDGGSSDEEEVFEIENHRIHSEYMTIKAINSFTQANLHSNGIYLLDFDSEALIWVGSDVPRSSYVSCFKHCGQALSAVHSKGNQRIDKIAFGFTFQGFEPEIFKNAFPAWEPFKKAGLEDNDQIAEESDEDSDSNSEEEKEKIKTEQKPSTELTEDEKKKIELSLPEPFWIN